MFLKCKKVLNEIRELLHGDVRSKKDKQMKSSKIYSLCLGVASCGVLSLLISCQSYRNALAKKNVYEGKGVVEPQPLVSYTKTKTKYSSNNNQWKQQSSYQKSNTKTSNAANKSYSNSSSSSSNTWAQNSAASNNNYNNGQASGAEKKAPSYVSTPKLPKPNFTTKQTPEIASPKLPEKKPATFASTFSKPKVDFNLMKKTPQAPAVEKKPANDLAASTTTTRVTKTLLGNKPATPKKPAAKPAADFPKPLFGSMPASRNKPANTKPAQPAIKQNNGIKVALTPVPGEKPAPPVKEYKVEKTVQNTPVKQTRKEVLVESDGTIQMINAAGKDVRITGNSGVIIIKGDCNRLTVTGSSNKITCGNVAVASIYGSDNIVAMRSVGGGAISGDRNDISWTTLGAGGEPNLKTTGLKNKVSRLR